MFISLYTYQKEYLSYFYIIWFWKKLQGREWAGFLEYVITTILIINPNEQIKKLSDLCVAGMSSLEV